MASSHLSFMISYLLSSLLLVSKAAALGGPTDTLTWGGDNSRCGYQTNHNMDPSIVGSANFGQIFKTTLPGKWNGDVEQIFAQPLVLTGNGGVQHIYIATTQNNIYKLDAKTGVIVKSRNLHVPFLTADLDGCVDINPQVGVTATGVIDPATGFWYLTAKTYSEEYQTKTFGPSNPPGRLNGRYYFHGIDTQSDTLADVFPPTPLEGLVFRNNPNRMFISGNQHQRPALLMVGDYIYTGYASHCVKWNFTGAIVGFNKNTGAVVEAFATQGGPEANTIPGGGVWMSGGGLAFDGTSMFFATGNGYAGQLSSTPVPGRQPPSALEEAVVNAIIQPDGTLKINDFFMPWEKQALDGADKDLGTSPLVLLPTSTFTCKNVKRMGVVTGKSGKTYVVNLDDLGGYRMGANNQDKVVFWFQNENSVYAGAGVMPLGGGYIYINIIQYQTRIFKFSCTAGGDPQFTIAGYTKEKNAYILGVGHGTTTSLNGREGTGLLWTSDRDNGNLRIYDAIPPTPGGNLTLLKSFVIPGTTKFTRPVFGNGRAYVGTTLGLFYGFGSPVNLPVNCTAPNEFGSVNLGATSQALTITCKALTQTTLTNITISGNDNFVVTDKPALGSSYAAGKTFTLTAVFKPKTVGPLASDILLTTTNAAAGFSVNTPITLSGTARSSSPLLQISPNTLSFGVTIGTSPGGQNQSALLGNAGDSKLTITSVKFSLTSETGPWVIPEDVAGGAKRVGNFTFFDLPSTIDANSGVALTVNYDPKVAGNPGCYVLFETDGGKALLDVFGNAGTIPVAVIEFEKADGTGWTKLDNSSRFTFGNFLEGTTKKRKLRITNGGTTTSAPLGLTISKPPYGVPGIIGASNNIDLGEGDVIQAGESHTAELYCSVPQAQVNQPSYTGNATWTFNTDDSRLGKVFIEFTCNAITEQFGPTYANGTAKWAYLGCYKENNPGRQLATQLYADTTNNTNQRCIQACSDAGWTLAGTQYQNQCWCGYAIPTTPDLDRECNYVCTGDAGQKCGGKGIFNNGARLSMFADTSRFVNPNLTGSPVIPQTVGQYNYVGCYKETTSKAFQTKQFADVKNMTSQACAAFCTTNKLSYMMLEAGQRCYCGSGIDTRYATLDSDANCNVNCRGNNFENCGAGTFGQIYAINGTLASATSSAASSSSSSISTVLSSTSATSASTSTISSSTSSSTSSSSSAVSSSSSSSSTTSTSSSSSSSSSSVSASSSSSSSTSSSPTATSPTSSSSSASSTATTSSTFSTATATPSPLPLTPLSPSSSSTPSTTSSTSATSASSSTSTVKPTPSVLAQTGNYTYQGCWNETSGRTLVAKSFTNTTAMTIESCAAFCNDYAWFGVEYANQCYCGPYPRAGAAPQLEASCNKLCPGNPLNYCGGSNRLQMYQTTEGGKLDRDPSIPTSVGNYGYTDCYVDNPRILPTMTQASNMTVDACIAIAEEGGYKYAGLEYGIQCFVGNTLPASLTAKSKECVMLCGGNKLQYCGAGTRLALYTRRS